VDKAALCSGPSGRRANRRWYFIIDIPEESTRLQKRYPRSDVNGVKGKVDLDVNNGSDLMRLIKDYRIR